MKSNAKTRVSRRKPGPRRAAASASLKGDIARAMFARWERDHRDANPMPWEQFKSTLEENRLREAPLFAK